MPCRRIVTRSLTALGLAIAFCVPVAAEEIEMEFRAVATSDSAPPSDAIVLFDGKGTNLFLNTRGEPCDWPVEEGALVSQETGHLVSKVHFRDAQLHVEFLVPPGVGNSGIYLHGQFELQILNTHGKKERSQEIAGAVYGIQAPLVNAARPAGEWQTYDIIYVAPRRENGQVVKPGSITALLNGVLVQFRTPVTESKSVYNPLVYRTTPYTDKLLASLKSTDAGPVFLQDHQNPVRFRNVWIRPLDDQAKEFGAHPE